MFALCVEIVSNWKYQQQQQTRRPQQQVLVLSV